MAQALEGAGQSMQHYAPQPDYCDTQVGARLPYQPQDPQNDFSASVDQPPAYSSALFKRLCLSEGCAFLTKESDAVEVSPPSTSAAEQE